MYVIGDWVDEYCDLTMDKLINEFAKKDKQVEYKIKEPLSLEELKREIYETDKSEQAEQNTKNTNNFFKKFKSWFKK
ncbi:transposase [Staphylococcus phage Alsa_2]|nr:transposase [Staphylococcus phage Alsa_2]